MLQPHPIFECTVEHGEGPVWDPKHGHLYWVDIMQSCFYRADATTGEFNRFHIGEHIGALALSQQGGLVIASRSGFGRYDFESGSYNLIGEAIHSPESNLRFNDGAIDPAGRFFVGSMSYNEGSHHGKLYRLDPDGQWYTVSSPYIVPNGITWSKDQATMYFIDTKQHCLFAFEYDVDSGHIAHRRVHIEFGPDLLADGMTRDEDEGFWIAFYGAGQVRRYHQNGDLDFIIDVPSPYTTSCCFGGSNMTTLFITTSRLVMNEAEIRDTPGAGRIFALETGYRGVVEPYFSD